MKCDVCGHENSKFDIVCAECKAPLNIDSNEFLKEKYKEKGKHIDIEEIEYKEKKTSFNDTRKSVLKAIIAIITVCGLFLLYLSYVFFVEKQSSKLMREYNSLMKDSPLLLIYFGQEVKVDELCQTYADNYDFDYLNIDASKLTRNKKKQVRSDLNIDNLDTTLVVVRNGTPVANIFGTKDTAEITRFLFNYDLIPLLISDTAPILEKLNTALLSEEKTVIYLETRYAEDRETKIDVLNAFSEQHPFDFISIEGFYLSKKQLLKIMSQLGYTEIQNNLFIYVYEGKIIKSIVDTASDANGYFELFSFYDIIDGAGEEHLAYINSSEFEELVNSKEKNVIIIGNGTTYCERIKPIAGSVASYHKIKIYYYDANNDRDKTVKIIQEMGYTGEITFPLTIIVEKGKIIKDMIGQVDKQLFTDTLIEYGVIR